MRANIPAAVAAVILTITLAGFAAEGELRNWTSAAGTTIRAKLVSVSPSYGGTITLERETGQKLSVKLNQVSAADQAYVKAFQEKMAAAKSKDDAGDSAAGDKGATDLDDAEWYLTIKFPIDPKEREVLYNFSLESGGKKQLVVNDAEGDFFNVYFAVDIGPELIEQYGGKDNFKLKLKQTNGEGLLQSNGGGGAPFQPQRGKIELEMSNESDKAVKIAISIDKNSE